MNLRIVPTHTSRAANQAVFKTKRKVQSRWSTAMALRDFSERTVKLPGSQPFSLAERPYLHALYRSQAKRIVIRASRQVEKSTYLVNRILYDAWRHPGLHILFVSPRQDQARFFSNVRLRGTI